MWTLCQALALHLPWQAFWLATPAPSRRFFQINCCCEQEKVQLLIVAWTYILWTDVPLFCRPMRSTRQQVCPKTNPNWLCWSRGCSQQLATVPYVLLTDLVLFPTRHQARPFHSKVLVSVSKKECWVERGSFYCLTYPFATNKFLVCLKFTINFKRGPFECPTNSFVLDSESVLLSESSQSVQKFKCPT